MKFDIFLEKLAEEDIDCACQWYRNVRIGLDDDFLDGLEIIFSRIADLPEAYPVVGKRLRRILFSKFSYGIYYLIDGTKIRVFAVMHTSRDPELWKKREH